MAPECHPRLEDEMGNRGKDCIAGILEFCPEGTRAGGVARSGVRPLRWVIEVLCSRVTGDGSRQGSISGRFD